MPDLIPASLIASLSKTVDEATMPDVATITTVDRTSDGAGGFTQVASSRISKCRFWSLDGDEAGDDQIKATGRHRIAFPLTVAVPDTATITVKGKVYNVKFAFPLNGYSTSRVIGLQDK